MVRQAINFGRSADGALGSNKVFPYVYNFIASQDDTSETFLPLAGVVNVVVGDFLRQLNGVGTNFLVDLIPGDMVLVGTERFIIQSITSNVLAIATQIPGANQVAQPISRARTVGGIGPTIPAGGYTRLTIAMREDYNFLPRWIRYTVNFFNDPLNGYEWWDRDTFVALGGTASVVLGDPLRQIVGVATTFLADLIPGDIVLVGTESFVIESVTNNLLAIAVAVPATNQVAQPVTRSRTAAPVSPPLFANNLSGYGVPLYRSVSVTLSYRPDGRFAIGGPTQQVAGVFNFGVNIPLFLEQLHGIDSGIAGVKVPYMLPAQGAMELTIYNNHATKALCVGGCVMGLKVRL